MPIAPLPAETAQRLTATLALNDATSVIKELVDNALDGRANTMSIELAANTLDTIQVRDNGQGIGIEDRQLLCKRGCTSKIRSIEELAGLGGLFLGFRGEALASITELSKFVIVTTRVDGELVGSALKFRPNGQLESSSSASHPSGTTVRIQDFLNNIPVRRQTALKSTAKTISNIHRLLAAYAYARPEVRYSFKVLKGKNDKAGWTYAPCRPEASLSDVASRIEGKEIANYCVEHEISSDGIMDVQQRPCWTVKGLFVDPNADKSKESSHTQSLSIDGRPVTGDRGLMKKLVKLYKQYLNQTLNSSLSSPSTSKPFLYLHIICPPETYDVNIEPAKDEVLFTDPTILEDLFEKLLQRIYGAVKVDAVKRFPHKNTGNMEVYSHSFDILLARKHLLYNKDSDAEANQTLPASIRQHMSTTDFGTSAHDSSTEQDNISLEQQNTMAGQAYDDMLHADEGVLTRNDSENPDNIIDAHNDSALEDDTPASMAKNPWSIASLNSRILPRRMMTNNSASSTVTPRKESAVQVSESQLATSLLYTDPMPHRTPLGGDWQLPTPDRSPSFSTPYQNPGPPMRRRAVVEDQDDDSDMLSAAEPEEHNLTVKTLDNWMTPGSNRSPDHFAPLSRVGSNDRSLGLPGGLETTQSTNRQMHFRKVSSSMLNGGQARIALQPFHDTRPFKIPTNRSDLHGRPHDDFSKPSVDTNAPRGPSQNSHQDQAILPTQNEELEEIMAFEYQKRAIAAQRRLKAKGGFKPPLKLPIPSASKSGSSVVSGSHVDTAVTSDNLPKSEREKAAFAARFGVEGATRLPPITKSLRGPLRDEQIGDPTRLTKSATSLQPNRHQPVHNNTTSGQVLRAQVSEALPHGHGHRPMHAFDILEGSSPAMPLTDPRAYLIRHRNLESLSETNTGLTRTGLKVRRVTTTKLPLEIIPNGSETYHFACVLSTDSLNLQQRDEEVGTLEKVDEYVRHGTVELIEWKPLPRHVKQWENVLKYLVQMKYRREHKMLNSDVDGNESTRLDEANVGRSDQNSREQRFDFDISLSRAIVANNDIAGRLYHPSIR